MRTIFPSARVYRSWKRASISIPLARPRPRSRTVATTQSPRSSKPSGNQLVVVPFGPPPRHAGSNRVVSLCRCLLDRVPDDARIGVRQPLLELGGQEPADDLDVLLRHRSGTAGDEPEALALILEDAVGLPVSVLALVLRAGQLEPGVLAGSVDDERLVD